MEEQNNNFVHIPREEYEELLECRTHISAVYDLITKRHEESIKNRGMASLYEPLYILELVSGYVENERYFSKLKKEYEERTEEKK